MDANWVENEAQVSIFGELEQLSRSPDSKVSGKAIFELAIAYAIGFGTQENHKIALSNVLKSAKKGYLPARAVFHAWHEAQKASIPVSMETQVDWLYEAAVWGSFYAKKCLERLDKKELSFAREEFHYRGGFNQFFYSRMPPPYIASEEFRCSMSSLELENHPSQSQALLETAVIYGDRLLVERLLQVPGIDTDVLNKYGESLIVLCCKGGHLEVLKVRMLSTKELPSLYIV